MRLLSTVRVTVRHQSALHHPQLRSASVAVTPAPPPPLALFTPLLHHSYSIMSERSIDSFFTKVSTPTKKMTANNRIAATTTTTTLSTPITTPATPDSSSSSSSKRKRNNDDVDEKDADEHDDKKVKEDDTDSTTPTTTLDPATTTTSQLHWTATLPTLLDSSWRQHLYSELTKPYFKQLCAQLLATSKTDTIFPPAPLIFNAFTLTPFDAVSVVILGQDPYHDNGQAEGLSFSVPAGVRVPSSLQNIYKELRDDIPGFTAPKHGSLTHWARQGVLLLNTTLTVTAHKANSHASYGWTKFTDAVISAINRDKRGVVFILWGAHAQKKAALIDGKRHHVLKGVHPSGLSANKGFFGSKPFSKCNAFLRSDGKPEIDWQV